MLEEAQLNMNQAMEEATDEAILVAAKQFPDLFEILVERYQKPFLRMAGRILNSKEAAEDSVQEAFLKIYRFSDQLRQDNDSKFKSWAYRIVFNTALTHYRKTKRHAGETEYLDTMFYDVLKDKDIAGEMNSNILVKEILEKMPRDLRELLEMHYLKELSYAEISREKNITIPALKMRLFRARELFRKLLESGEEKSALKGHIL
ncbi:RNA polymerase sigma factor [Candidatus Giovannonibacteria bacterium]|nr:RNA polymerase sigma factor [Candidatus Giovannonibacteria bacterium]